MDFRLLGPFEAHHNGHRVPVGRRKERCLLAVLLLEAGRIVPVERLSDLLWDGLPPDSARGTIHTYIGRLRRGLEPYGVHIDTRNDGYLVETDQHSLDTDEFTRLASLAASTTDPAERILLYDRALALWRGPLLADVADDRLRTRLESELNERRLSGLELRAEAQLAMGHHDQVVTDLTSLAERYPGRERLVAALMTGLYRCRRKAEAVRAYRATQRFLAEDLGVEAGPALQALHEQIVRGDPGLERPPGPVYAVRVRGHWLPWSTAGHPALDFCNTFAGWGGPRQPGSEWLRSYATLTVWAGHLDLLDDWTVSRLLRQAQRDPLGGATALEEARVLRANLYACLTNIEDERAFDVVARFAEAAAMVSVFERDADGGGRWRLAPSAGLRLPILAVARCAADLLTDVRRHTIRACPSPECGWLFIDQSSMRRFCSIATCGAHASHASHDELRPLRDGRAG